MNAGASKKRVIILLADGARPDVLEDEIRSGNLPNIARYFVQDGTYLKGVTSFPSTTGPAYLPFLTGCLPGTCNVPGIRWFDKSIYDKGWSFNRYRSYVGFESFCMGSDMRSHIKTMFDLVPDSYSIFNPIAKGAGKRNLTRISRIWHWYYGHLTDRWGFVDSSAMLKLRTLLKKKSPRFVFAVFPGLDEYSHFTHPKHESVLLRYRWMDGEVGALISDLKIRGEWKDTAIFIVSDHGLSETHTHFCVNDFLERHKLPPFYYPLIFKRKGKLSANMVSGNGMTHIYFKNKNGWKGEVTRDKICELSPKLLDDLLREEAIDIIACRNDSGGIDVMSRRGEASIFLKGDKLTYKVKGKCPFGYRELPEETDDKGMLGLTFDSEYPDAPFQIAHLMMSPRSGDLILSATPGFDLRLKYEHPEHFGSHGSLNRLHMCVPILSNLKFEPGAARTVDVFPTALNLLGYKIPDYIDGRALTLKS